MWVYEESVVPVKRQDGLASHEGRVQGQPGVPMSAHTREPPRVESQKDEGAAAQREMCALHPYIQSHFAVALLEHCFHSPSPSVRQFCYSSCFSTFAVLFQN